MRKMKRGNGMGNGKKSGPDWEHFEKLMGARFPFMPQGIKGRMEAGGDWIGKYVEEVLKQSFGAAGEEEEEGKGHREETASSQVRTSSSEASELDYDYGLFETHTSVIVRVEIPAEVHIRNVRVYASDYQLKLEQDPSRKKLYIRLPHAVDHASVKAVYKDRVLEIRLTKADEAELFREVRIRNL
ncbi:Hsp20/alpha crystallin family protein [Gorillibacterium sp. sgz5001074]|uniref:Hsp20/alpha crystallin family protein n=1 Tax=Gorillibacterium sp. sgz5001074 TaxID=3446695 RepID=UPI003F66D328